MSLTSIFDNDQSVLLGQSNDRVHIGHLSVKMNRNDSRYWASAALADELFRLVDRTLVLQIVAKLLRVHVVRAFVDVDELRKSPRLCYCFRGGNECVGDGYDHLARLYSRGHQGTTQSIGSAADRHGMRSST